MSIIQAELTNSLVPIRIAEEQREIPTMPYLVKPLSGRLFLGISTLGTAAFQHSSHPFFRSLGHVVVAVGYVAGTIFAVAETFCLLGFGLSVELIHHATNRRFELINDLSLHAYSMSIHSATLAVLQVVLLYKRVFSEYHSFNLLLAHLVQHVSYPLLALVDKVDPDYRASSIKSFIEDGALLEILYTLRRDFRPDVSEYEFSARLNERSLQAFFHLHPEHKATVRGSDLFSILDQEHREKWRKLVSDFVNFQFQEIPNLLEIEIDNNPHKDYQERLCGYIKAAFKQIYTRDAYLKHIEGGKEAFDGLYATIILPLARYAELLELEDKVLYCPQSEEKEIKERYALIESCRNRLRHSDGRSKLVESLLTGETNTELAQDIANLSVALHKGKLLIKTTYNINLPPEMARSDANLFVKACQEALQEL